MSPLLYLASGSPRRKLLLSRLTRDFETITTDITEVPGKTETPLDYVVRVAMDKAHAARTHLPENALILASDTEVVFNGQVLGKPADRDAAIEMLMQLSAHCHEVHTAVVLLRQQQISKCVNTSRVCFRTLERAECEDYVDTCKPLDKAGGYGIQERAAAFISRFEGSFSGVMGLPLTETRHLLEDNGMRLNDGCCNQNLAEQS